MRPLLFGKREQKSPYPAALYGRDLMGWRLNVGTRLAIGFRLLFGESDNGTPRSRDVSRPVDGWKCRSRSGYGRDKHTPDKDSRCIFCDRLLVATEVAQ